MSEIEQRGDLPSDRQILSNKIKALVSRPPHGRALMVVDALAEAWRMGMASEAGYEELVALARRHQVVVCCPLGNLDPASVILASTVSPGMRPVDVIYALGEASKTINTPSDVTWVHELPLATRPTDPADGSSYTARQAAWARPDASDDDPPFAPLVVGEGMFLSTKFEDGLVTCSRVVVLQYPASNVNGM
ncbi:hypothetical protein [Sphingomonas sp.]|uniref:hypothetical protein n=1 Tax=Sphingomonas sp. TaxID=28214 RepID=UPI0025EE7D62|nr:hypothetical protein [Sphingomonas sp.]